MLISMNKLREALGEARWQTAEGIVQHGGVHESDTGADFVHYLISGIPGQRVMLNANGTLTCTCADFSRSACCAHLGAAVLYAQQTGTLARLEHRRATLAGPELLGAMDALLPSESPVRLEVNLFYESDPSVGRHVFRLGLRIGEERLYVVRSVIALLDAIRQKKRMDFGKGFTLLPEWMHFSQTEARLL